MIEQETINTIIKLDKRVRSATNQIHNSAVACTVYDPTLGMIFGEMEFTVTDLLLITILSRVHVLLTGPSGCAKTDLSKLMCSGVFGQDGFKTLRLNTSLSEDTISDTDTTKLFKGECTVNDSIHPEDYLKLPCVIIDEANRAPAALSNLLLGLSEEEIHIKCGVRKADVGYRFKSTDGKDCYYHYVIGTMNEGKEFSGTFPMDPAFRRRFPVEIPLGDLRPTPYDDLKIDEQRDGPVSSVNYDSLVDETIQLADAVTRLPLNPLAKTYLSYLKKVGRCPYSPSGFHPEDSSQQLCIRNECRIQKTDNGFCSSVGCLSKACSISLKRVSRGLATLRIARTIETIEKVCKNGDSDKINQLQEFVNCEICGNKLQQAAIKRYLEMAAVEADDIKAMVPFVGLGGKIWMAPPYISKHFCGFGFFAMKNYAQLTYSKLKHFFVQNRTLFQQLANGNGVIEQLKKRLEIAERTNDPFIRYTIEPYLNIYESKSRSSAEIAEQISATEPIRGFAKELLCE